MRFCLHFRTALHFIFKSFSVIKISQLRYHAILKKDDLYNWQRPTWVPYADLLRRRWCRLAAWQQHTHTVTQTQSLMHTNTHTHAQTSFSHVAQTLTQEHDETKQQCTKPVFQRCRNNIILTHTSTRRLQA